VKEKKSWCKKKDLGAREKNSCGKKKISWYQK